MFAQKELGSASGVLGGARNNSLADTSAPSLLEGFGPRREGCGIRGGVTFARNDSGGAYPKLEPILRQFVRLGVVGRSVCCSTVCSLILWFTMVATCEYKACYTASTFACVKD